MLRLHGFPVSNYTNMVAFALLEKGVPFEYVLTMPEQGTEFLTKSPRGKVPFLETPQGYINETSVILDFLEDSGQGKPLLPADPYQRALARVLLKEIEIYIELPARSCFAEAFFGGKVPDAVKDRARDDLLGGFATLKRHAKFTPFVAGDMLTTADIMFLYSVDLAAGVSKQLFGVDPLDDMPAARALLLQLGENPHAKSIAAARDANMPGFIAAMRARFHGAR